MSPATKLNSSTRRARRGLPAALSGLLALSLTVGFGGQPQTARAATGNSVAVQADATVRRSSQTQNFGAERALKVRRYRAFTYLAFDLKPMLGQAIGELRLQIRMLRGDTRWLKLQTADPTWSESQVVWATRPSAAPPALRAVDLHNGFAYFDLRPLFPSGVVDRSHLSLRVSSTSANVSSIAARETGNGAGVVLTPPSQAIVSPTNASDPQRFYTPNIKVDDDSQLRELFSSTAEMAPILRNVDVYSFFAVSLTKNNPEYDAMVARSIPMLAQYGVKLGLEVGGPLGYAPGVVYGGDIGGENGRKSAVYDVSTRVSKIERMGGQVSYLMLDGALRRTIRNGVHHDSHAAFITIGTTGNRNGLTYRAVDAGARGNSIRIGYQVPSIARAKLWVSVSGSDIVVHLATDAEGRAVSTAEQVRAAVASTPAAMALVTVANQAGSDGSGLLGGRSLTALAWGDDGLNMTPAQSVAELVSYIKTVHALRPAIRFVLLEDVVLWPYDGAAGYASIAYPRLQRPDFKYVWNELVSQLQKNGMLKYLVAFHNDVSVEYLDRQVPSINRTADDWYGQILKQQAQVEAAGVAFGQHFNSLYGGTPALSSLASPAYFQSQVLHSVSAIESYRLAHRPNMDQMDDFVFDAFMRYPSVVSPSTVEYSTDDTYLDALALFTN